MSKGKRKKRKEKKSFFARFREIAFWTIIGGILGFFVSFTFPDGIETLNHYGWIGFSTFQFDFQNFDTNYRIFQNSTQPLGIHHYYKTKAYPKLNISSNNPDIKISCIHRDTGQKCEKSFPIDDYGYAQVEVNIRINYTNKNTSILYFEIMENGNNRIKNKKIFIKR